MGNRLGGTGIGNAVPGGGAGNGSKVGDVFTIDRTAPNVVIDSTSPATINGTGSSTITWHANENGTYSVRVGGTNCSTGTQVSDSSGSGNYTTQPNTVTTTVNAADLANGENTVRVCVTDGVGPSPNTGSATTTITYNPVQTTSINSSSITATTSTYGGTTDLSATVAPSGAPGSVEFYVNGSSTAASGTVNYNQTTGVATLSNYAHGLNASNTAYSVKAVFTSSSANYTNSDATNTSALTVNKRSITVTPDTGQSKVYGTTPDPTLTYHLANGTTLASGDTLDDATDGALSRASGETVAGGPYAIQQGSLVAAANGNYTLNFDANNVTFAITPKPITVTADNKTKQLGANDPPLTYSVPSGSLAFNDTPATVFNGSLTRDPGENVGVSYTIRKGTLSTNSNYTIGTFNNGTLKIVYGGGFLGIQQPINGGMGESIALTANSVGTGHDTDFDDDTSRFKLGSTVPVKFELRDASGAPVTAANVVTLTVKVADNKPDPGVDEPISTSAATTGNAFRLADATTGQYMFNLSTKSPYTNPNTGAVVNFTSQGTYTLSVLLKDGTSRSVNIQLVK